MKRLLPGIAVLFLVITTAPETFAQSQYRAKKQMFHRSSDRISAGVTELEKAFDAKQGDTVLFDFPGLKFNGEIINSIKRFDNLYSTIIRLEPDGTVFSLSKRINEDKSVTYTGRVLNSGASDGFELVKEPDGSYNFQKILTEDLIQDY